jgi:hypothetical protein
VSSSTWDGIAMHLPDVRMVRWSRVFRQKIAVV